MLYVLFNTWEQLKNPSDLITQIKSVIDRGNMSTFKQNTAVDPRYTLHSKCFVPIIAELLQLCVIMGTTQQDVWTVATQNLVADYALIGDIDVCMKKG